MNYLGSGKVEYITEVCQKLTVRENSKFYSLDFASINRL